MPDAGPNAGIPVYGPGQTRSTLAWPVLRTAPPRVLSIDDGIVTPDAQPGAATAATRGGGVVTRHGLAVETANLYRRGGKLTFGLTGEVAGDPVAEDPGEVIYLGWFMHHHYGHFLLESLARSWHVLGASRAVRVAVLPYARPRLRDPFRRILDLLDLAEDQILFIERATRFARVHVPEALYELLGGAHEQAIRPFAQIAERVLAGSAPAVSAQPVYLSRSALPEALRSVIGEQELEAALCARGFLIVHPERMSLDEQVLLFNSHTDIVGCFGSAMHTVLFARQRPRLHLLTSERTARDFLLTPALAGASLAMVNCLAGPNATRAPRTLDLPTALDYVDAAMPR